MSTVVSRLFFASLRIPVGGYMAEFNKCVRMFDGVLQRSCICVLDLCLSGGVCGGNSVKRSRSSPVLGSVRPPVVLCPINDCTELRSHCLQCNYRLVIWKFAFNNNIYSHVFSHIVNLIPICPPLSISFCSLSTPGLNIWPIIGHLLSVCHMVLSRWQWICCC